MVISKEALLFNNIGTVCSLFSPFIRCKAKLKNRIGCEKYTKRKTRPIFMTGLPFKYKRNLHFHFVFHHAFVHRHFFHFTVHHHAIAIF